MQAMKMWTMNVGVPLHAKLIVDKIKWLL